MEKAKTIYRVGEFSIYGDFIEEKLFEKYSDGLDYFNKLIKKAKKNENYEEEPEDNIIFDLKDINKIIDVKPCEVLNKVRVLKTFKYLTWYKCSYEYDEYDLVGSEIQIREVKLH